MIRKTTLETDVDVDAVLRQLKQAKDKELRLRAEKERVRKELEALRSGDLWVRETATQNELETIRARKRELQTRETAESERLRSMDATLREKEVSAHRSRRSKLAIAASAIVAPSPQTYELAPDSADHSSDLSEINPKSTTIMPTLSLMQATSKTHGAQVRISNQQADEFEKVARLINLENQQTRIKELEDRLEMSKALQVTASVPCGPSSRLDKEREDSHIGVGSSSMSPESTLSGEYSESTLHPRDSAMDAEQAPVTTKASLLFGHCAASQFQPYAPMVSSSFADPRPRCNSVQPQLPTMQSNPLGASIVSSAPILPMHVMLSQHAIVPTFPFPAFPTWGFPSSFVTPNFLSCVYSPSVCNPTLLSGFTTSAPTQQPQTVNAEVEFAQLQRQIDKLKRQEQQADDENEFLKVQRMISSLQQQVQSLSHSSEIVQFESRPKTGSPVVDGTVEGIKVQMSQFSKAMLKVRNQRDLLEEQDKLEEMQDRIEKRREERKRDHHREEWMAKQKRELVSLRLKRALGKADESKFGAAFTLPELGNSARSYDPTAGVLICWDFVTGLPVSLETAQLTFAVYDGKILRSAIKSIALQECEADGPVHKRGIFAIKRTFQPLSASSAVVLVAELSSVSSTISSAQPAIQRLGWTAIKLFSCKNHEPEAPRLISGWFKTNLVSTTMPDPSKVELHGLDTNGESAIVLHFRIARGDLDVQTEVSIDPDTHAVHYRPNKEYDVSDLPQPLRSECHKQASGLHIIAEDPQLAALPRSLFDSDAGNASDADSKEQSAPLRTSQSHGDYLDLERFRLLSSSSARPSTGSVRPRSTLSAAQRSRVGGGVAALPAVKESSPLDDSHLSSPWLRGSDNTCHQRQRSHQFQPGDGFDVYIDGGRFLPDIVSITKVTIAALNADKSKISPLDSESNNQFSLFRGGASNPTYNLHVEYRKEAFNHILTLVIRLDTLDPRNRQPVILGYSLIPVFIDMETEEQASRPNCQFALNVGAFQLLPVYTNVSLDVSTNGRNAAVAIGNIPRVPCASVLVRIKRAAMSEDGLQVLSRRDFPPTEWLMRGLEDPAPPYQSGAYDSSMSVPSPSEMTIYRARDGENTSVQNALAALGLNESNSQALLQAKPLSFIDLRGAYRYRSSLGLRVSIDGLHNVKVKAGSYYRVLYSIYPPGSFYRPIRLTNAVQFTTTTDWTSLPTSPEFSDGFTPFRGTPYDPRMVVIVDVRTVTKNSKTGVYTSQPLAWSFAPVIDERMGSVLSGGFQVPLFTGEVNMAILDASPSLTGLAEEVSAEKKKSVLPFMDGASLFLRLENPQVATVLSTQPFAGAVMSSMIPTKILGISTMQPRWLWPRKRRL